MSPLLSLLAGCALLPAGQAETPAPLRYLKPAGEKLVFESDVTVTTGNDGTDHVSLTERGRERMTLTLHYTLAGRLISAEAVLEGPTRRSAALLLEEKGRGQLKRAGTTDFLKDLPADPVVTTAPDWSDIFQLVRRYDAAKGGKQEFAGLWFHPVQAIQKLTFAIERLGDVMVTVKEKGKDVEVKLNRFRVKLRSGDYSVWADASGRVVRIVAASGKEGFIVLQGFQEATKGLNP